MGFTLQGTEQISRCAKTKERHGFDQGIQMKTTDAYCLNGQHLIPISQNTYRLNNNLKMLFTAHGQTGNGPTYWEQTLPSGERFFYGQNTGITKVQDSVLSWWISRRSDIHNNHIDYHYQQLGNNSVTYLSKITYPGFKIDFLYQDKTDSNRYYIAGQAFDMAKRLVEIKLHSASNQLIKKYQLVYDKQTNVMRNYYSRLKEIKLCNKDNICTNPHQIHWAQNDVLPVDEFQRNLREHEAIEEIDFDKDGIVDLSYSFSPLEKKAGELSFNYDHPQFVDINRDGSKDVCYLRDAALYCAASQGDGNFAEPQLMSQRVPNISANETQLQPYLLDVNHDGLVDYCQSNPQGVYCALMQDKYP